MSFRTYAYKHIIYDSVTLIMYGDPVVGNEWANYVQKTCPNISANFSMYDKCFYSVSWYDDGQNLVRKADDIPMPSSMGNLAADVKLMTNNSGGSFTEYAIVQFYDKMDYAIPRLEKIYGYNTGMYFVKGRREARNRRQVTAQMGNRWGELYTFIDDAYNAVFGVHPNPLPTDGNNGWGVMWTSGNPRKDYGAPKNGTQLSPGRAEKMYCDGAGYHSALGLNFTLGDPVTAIFYSYASYEFQPYYSARTSTNILSCLTQLLIYPVTQVGTPTHRALYVKPIGIDNISIDYFDPSIYRIESIGMRKDKSPQILKHPSITSNKMSKNGCRIDRSQWNSFTREMTSIGCTPPYRIKFWLRDLRTNRVGPFTSGTIVPIINTRFKRLHFMVK